MAASHMFDDRLLLAPEGFIAKDTAQHLAS